MSAPGSLAAVDPHQVWAGHAIDHAGHSTYADFVRSAGPVSKIYMTTSFAAKFALLIMKRPVQRGRPEMIVNDGARMCDDLLNEALFPAWCLAALRSEPRLNTTTEGGRALLVDMRNRRCSQSYNL